MAFDWVVLRGEDSFVKYVLSCFSVIHISTAVGEAEETAACMYIHYRGLGTGGEIMCFSLVSDYQNKVYIVLDTVPCWSSGAVAICWNTWAGVLCDKNVTGYEFVCLFERLRKQREIVATTRKHDKIGFISPSVHFLLGSFLLTKLIGDIAFITSELALSRMQKNEFSTEWRPRCPSRWSLLLSRVPDWYRSTFLARRSACILGGKRSPERTAAVFIPAALAAGRWSPLQLGKDGSSFSGSIWEHKACH